MTAHNDTLDMELQPLQKGRDSAWGNGKDGGRISNSNGKDAGRLGSSASRGKDGSQPSRSCAQALANAISTVSFNPTLQMTGLLVISWYTLSTCLSVFNKKLMGNKYGIIGGEPFPAPVMLSSLQFALQHCLARGLHASGVKRLTSPDEPPMPWGVYVRTVVPNGVATGLDIGFSNAAMATITLSFYTMCKSSAPLFLLFFAFIWRLERPSWALAGIVLVISSGLLMLVSGEAEFELRGFVLVMSAACLSGLRWTITQVSLQGSSASGSHTVVKGSALEVIEALTPIMAVITALTSILSEPLNDALHNSAYFDSLEHVLITLVLGIAGGCIGLLMVWVEFRLISATSSLTFMVAGVFKEILTVFVAHFLYGDHFTALNAAGLCVLIFGVSLFNWHKYVKSLELSPHHTSHTSACTSPATPSLRNFAPDVLRGGGGAGSGIDDDLELLPLMLSNAGKRAPRLPVTPSHSPLHDSSEA